MKPASVDLFCRIGATFSEVFRWASLPIVYKAITAIPSTAPATLTVAAHGAPNGWPVAVSGVNGMTQINANFTPPATSDYHAATVIDTNTIALNDVNPNTFSAYTSGGVLQYYSPINLTGMSAKLSIFSPANTTPAALVLNSPQSGSASGIALDTSAQTITVNINATDTAAIAFSSGVYELALTDSSGNVTILATGAFNIVAATESC